MTHTTQTAKWTYQTMSRGVEVSSDRQDVVEGTEYNGIGHGCDGSGGDVETHAPDRDEGPGGHQGEQDEMGAIKHDQKRQSDGDGSRIDRRWTAQQAAT